MIDGIIPWLEQQMERKAAILRLHHVSDKAVIEEWELDGQKDAAELAQCVLENTNRETNVFGRAQKYQLVVIVDKQIRARFSFHSEVAEDGDALQLDMTTQSDVAVALLQQSHRHIEGLTRSLVAVSLGNTKAHLSEISRLAHRNDENERRLDAMRDAHERSLDTQFERDIRRKKFDADERRLDDGISTFRGLLPFVVNSIAKKQVVPTGSTSVLHEAMRPVMETVTTEQIEKLQQVLTPAQMIGLMEVWRLVTADSKGKTADEKAHEGNPKTR